MQFLKMVALALKLAKGEEIGTPDEEIISKEV